MPVTDRTLRLQRRIERDLAKITDAQTRALVSAWVRAWNEIEGELTAALLEQLVAGEKVSRAKLLRSTRLRKALQTIASSLRDLAAQAGVTITADLQRIVDEAGAAQASVIDSQLPPKATQLVDLDTWSRVDDRQIAAIVKRSTEQIVSRTRPLSAEAYAAVRAELLRGVAAGANPRQTARRIILRSRQRFDGGLTRALRVARTEVLDAHRSAAALAQAEHADVLAGWVWLADLSGRVCPACLSEHGTRHPLSDPGPLGHQNCRCSRVPVAKTWAELGITDVQEPPSLLPDAQTWFDGLPAADQRTILGPTRLQAYQDGAYPMSTWSTRKSTPGWRDSYVVSPAPGTAARVPAA